MPFAILRFTKHKSAATIRAASDHMERSRETLNADETRRSANSVLVGAGVSPADAVDARFEAHTTGIGREPRANGVRAIEVFVGASPEFFATASPTEVAAWERQSHKWLADTFGRDNVVSLTMHQDEKSPHLTGFIVPVDPDTGRLNARRWTGDPRKLRTMQTDYADAVADLGLSRGVEGSTATHQTVKQFYGALGTDVGTVIVPSVAVPPVSLSPRNREEWAERETARLQAGVSPQVTDLAMKARAGLVSSDRVKSLQKDASETQRTAASVRELPLSEVLAHLGLRPDPKAKSNPQHIDAEGRFRITIDGRTFHDHADETRGKGAIDLAKHVLERDYKGAVAWLAGTMGAQATTGEVAARAVERAPTTVATIQKTTPVFALPPVEPDRRLIHAYLSKQRSLDHTLVERFIDEGRIVSDARRNVGFVMHDENGVPRGMELRGTGPSDFTGLAPGSSRNAAFRIEATSASTTPKRSVVLVSSAIEALSYIHLAEDDGPTLIASTAGSRSTLPESLRKAVASATDLVVAFFNDATGNASAARLFENLKGWWKGRRVRRRPASRTFNGDLRGEPAVRNSKGQGLGL